MTSPDSTSGHHRRFVVTLPPHARIVGGGGTTIEVETDTDTIADTFVVAVEVGKAFTDTIECALFDEGVAAADRYLDGAA